MLYTQVRWSSWYIVHLDHSIFTVSRWLTQNAHALHQISTTSLSSTKPFVNTHRPGSTAASFFHHCSMSRFWQLFRPALARKAGQLDPQTLVGSLVAGYGTSRSKSGKARSSHYPQWHCGPKLHLLVTNDILHLLDKHSTTSPQRAHRHQSVQCAMQRFSAKVSARSEQTVVKASKQRAQSPYLK